MNSLPCNKRRRMKRLKYFNESMKRLVAHFDSPEFQKAMKELTERMAAWHNHIAKYLVKGMGMNED